MIPRHRGATSNLPVTSMKNQLVEIERDQNHYQTTGNILKNTRVRFCKLRVLVTQTNVPEFDTQDPHKGARSKLIQKVDL